MELIILHFPRNEVSCKHNLKLRNYTFAVKPRKKKEAHTDNESQKTE